MLLEAFNGKPHLRTSFEMSLIQNPSRRLGSFLLDRKFLYFLLSPLMTLSVIKILIEAFFSLSHAISLSSTVSTTRQERNSVKAASFQRYVRNIAHKDPPGRVSFPPVNKHSETDIHLVQDELPDIKSTSYFH